MVSNPARQRHELLDAGGIVHSDSLVHAAVEGERFEGRLTAHYEFNETVVSESGAHQYAEEERDTHNILWQIEHNGEVWQANPVEITARLVRLQNNIYVPLEGPIQFGEAFAVEGTLEKPAARQVYRLELNYGEEQPYDVFLYPTEEDTKLLRTSCTISCGTSPTVTQKLRRPTNEPDFATHNRCFLPGMFSAACRRTDTRSRTADLGGPGRHLENRLLGC